jgi:hypothetical protein
MPIIEKQICLGKRQYEYTATIGADVTREYANKGDYEVGFYDITFCRHGKQIKGKRHDILEARFFKEYDTGEIDDLLIQASEV